MTATPTASTAPSQTLAQKLEGYTTAVETEIKTVAGEVVTEAETLYQSVSLTQLQAWAAEAAALGAQVQAFATKIAAFASNPQVQADVAEVTGDAALAVTVAADASKVETAVAAGAAIAAAAGV